MIDYNRIRRQKNDGDGIYCRGFLELSYFYDVDLVYSVWISIDPINCIRISIGESVDKFISFHIFRNNGYSANDYLNYIKNNMDPSKIPDGYSIDIFRELLSDQEFCDYLDSCIKNIPDVPNSEEEKQIAKAREIYNNTMREAMNEALKNYEHSIRCIASTTINIEHALEFAPEGSFGYGLIDGDFIEEHRF